MKEDNSDLTSESQFGDKGLSAMLRDSETSYEVDSELKERVRRVVAREWENEIQRRESVYQKFLGVLPGRRQHSFAAFANASRRYAFGILLAFSVTLATWWSVGDRFANAPTGTNVLSGSPSGSLDWYAGEVVVRSGENDARYIQTSDESLSASSLELFGEDRLITGTDSQALVSLFNDVQLRIASNSEVYFPNRREVHLISGTLYFDSDHIYPVFRADIFTPLGRIENLGTQYEVSTWLEQSEQQLSIRVREGTVKLIQQHGDVMLENGIQFRTDENNESRLQSVPVSGQSWEWVESIPVDYELDGRSLDEFTRWLCREKGWLLKYRDDEIARLAFQEKLSGSTAGLTLDQALEIVYSTTSFSYELDQETLLVDLSRNGGLR